MNVYTDPWLIEANRRIMAEREAKRQVSKAGSFDTRKHGTLSGFQRHQQLHEEACDPCKKAKREYSAKWRRGATK